MIRNCFICGNGFRTFPSKIALGRGKYCSKKCCLKITGIKTGSSLSPHSQFKKGQVAHNFKGFRLIKPRKGGHSYKQIFCPEHPHASKAGYVREHRLVMEKFLGRYLDPSEVVHHKNGDTLDNSIENLEVMSAAEHRREHLQDTIHRRWQTA